jgi:hypothetical protein
MCCSLWLHVLEYFSTVLPTPPKKAGIEWCAALWLRVLEYFSTVPPTISTYEAGLSDVLLFVIPRLRVFFNSPTQFPPMKQGLSDVLLFVITR